MKKLIRTGATFLFALFISTFSLWAQSSTRVALENNGGDLYILTLENGFTVFVKEDYSTALVHGVFVSRAGFDSQTATTAGFFPLHASLFRNRTVSKDPGLFKTLALNGSCNQFGTSFWADMTAQNLEAFLSDMAQSVMSADWSDSEISLEYEAMKKQVLDYEATTSGFINTSIDSRVFSDSPWKHDSGVYPALFTSHTLGEARTILTDISMRFYTPDNCALFISGNVSRDNVYRLCHKYFSEWKNTCTDDAYSPSAVKATKNSVAPTEQKKFVITDDSFSKELTQLAVQFTDLSLSQADILSSAFNSVSSPYVKSELGDEAVAIRSRDYLAAASAQYNRNSRLILQALLEAPYSFSNSKSKGKNGSGASSGTTGASGTAGVSSTTTVSPLVQAELFVEHAKKSAALDAKSFDAAKKEVSAQYKLLTGNSVRSMELLSDFWAMTPGASPSEFYSQFLTLHQNLQAETLESLKEEISEIQPYVFVMVNTEIYSKYSKEFEKAGYSHVTRTNASWYRDELVKAKALSPAPDRITVKAEELFDEENFSPAEKFYYENSLRIESDTLSNGIPLTVRSVPNSQSITLSIAIEGGEASSPNDQHCLRTILVNYFAVNLQQEISRMQGEGKIIGQVEVNATTEDTMSYITMTVSKDDYGMALEAASRAIVYGEILPVAADRIVYEQKSKWNQKVASMDYQMKSYAMRTMYKGTELEKIYDITTPILQKTTYNGLVSSYTALLDASLYSIIICGDTDLEQSMEFCQNAFGVLKEQTARGKAKTIKAVIMPKTEKLEIRHTFTTDKPAEDARGVPILVPTTEFKDPIQYYISAPKDQDQIELFNALLLEIQYRMNCSLGEQATCIVDLATRFKPYACVRTNAILHTQSFINAYKNAVSSLKADLEKNTPGLLEATVTRWSLQVLGKTQTFQGTVELMQQALLTGPATQFLTDYVTVQDADKAAFVEVMKFIPDDATYKLYSESSTK